MHDKKLKLFDNLLIIMLGFLLLCFCFPKSYVAETFSTPPPAPHQTEGNFVTYILAGSLREKQKLPLLICFNVFVAITYKNGKRIIFPFGPYFS
jgi:hypothetical protein